jgi:hypothetical protein
MPGAATAIVEGVEKVVEKVGEVIAGPFPTPTPTPSPVPSPTPVPVDVVKTTSNKYLWYILGGITLGVIALVIYKSMQAKTSASNKT